MISEWARPQIGKNSYSLGAASELIRLAEAEKAAEEAQAIKTEEHLMAVKIKQEEVER